MKYLSLSFLVIFSICLQVSLSIAEDRCGSGEACKYREDLIERAVAAKLAYDREWLSLLHYEKSLFGTGYKSLASGELFFLAPGGKYDPQAELIATIRSFFYEGERSLRPDDKQPYACAFIARSAWLDKKLSFDRSLLPAVECQRFKEWYAGLNPAGLTLIFPSTYINNPASAFGHTLLRIDQPNQGDRTRLLAYTANFAAATAGENALLYGLYGIFGGYRGFFSVAPYYEKVTVYSDIEKRDIWEYQLNFSLEEIQMMLMHLWELRSVPFSYYYFDENCSYHLLALLNTARPSLDLTSSFPAWALPVDTVKELMKKEGLVGEAVYRPSVLTKLNEAIEAAPRDLRRRAKKISETGEDLSDLSPSEQAITLDLAYQYANYQILSGKSDRTGAAFKLLTARSALPPLNAVKAEPPRVRPENGHETARIGASSGIENRRWFFDLRYRGVYHDLLDPQQGFSPGSQIEIGDIVIRQYEDGPPSLKKATFVNIMSLNPGNEFIKPLSWGLSAGLKDSYLSQMSRHHTFNLQGGAGRTWKMTDNSFAYLLLNLDSKFTPHFDDNYAFGAGPRAGLIIDANEAWRLLLTLEVTKFALGEDHSDLTIGLDQRFTISENSALRIGASRQSLFGYSNNQFILSFDFYL